MLGARGITPVFSPWRKLIGARPTAPLYGKAMGSLTSFLVKIGLTGRYPGWNIRGIRVNEKQG